MKRHPWKDEHFGTRKNWKQWRYMAAKLKELNTTPLKSSLKHLKYRNYTVNGVGSFICTEKAIDKQLPVGHMNWEKFKIMIKDEMNTKLGVDPT